MLLADQPAYLQPRIRHITSIRIHRLTVEYDDEDAVTEEHALDGFSNGADASKLQGRYNPHSNIEGYDLALPEKGVRQKVAESRAFRSEPIEQASISAVEDVQEPMDLVIDRIVAEESTPEPDGMPDNIETLRRTSSRDVPEPQFRRNRRRTSQSSNSVATLRVLQETVEIQRNEPHCSDLESPLSPSPANSSGAPWFGTESLKPVSRRMNSSRSGSFTLASSSPGQCTSGLPSVRRPSLSMHRSRSRLTIPRHVDRAKSSDDELRSTSPLISPVSPAFDGAFSSNLSGRPSGRTSSLRNPSVSSFRGQTSLLPEETSEPTPNCIDIHTDSERQIEQPASEDHRTQNGGDLEGRYSQSVPSMQEDLRDFDKTRARSTSTASARTSAYSHHPASQQTSSLYPNSRAIHRRERSATISSHSLDPLLPPPSTLLSGRPNLSTLVSHPEEDAVPLSEEVAYVDQKILRNRLVRCFITFASVEHGQKGPQNLTSSRGPRRTDIENSSGGDSGKAVSRRPPPTSSTELRDIANALTPFYISPIHVKSTHPTFSGLTPRSDYANWLSTRKTAAHKILVEVWVELDIPNLTTNEKESDGINGDERKREPLKTKWRKLKHVGGIVDLRRLRELGETQGPRLPENTLIFNFSNWGDRLYYFESSDGRRPTSQMDPDIPADSMPPNNAVGTTVRSVMERSLRETKMRTSIRLGELHHMMNLYHVIRDTQFDVQRIAQDLNSRVSASAKCTEESRACSKQMALSEKFRDSLKQVESGNQKTRARIHARRLALQTRRQLLEDAKTQRAMLNVQLKELESSFGELTSATQSLQLPIYRYRARCVAIIDEIFEITPLDAPSLLYSILKVPLPIPQHPSEAAPPLSLPSSALPRGVKVDEDTISTALGFVAMAINQISHIWERPLHYPVTCAGSKSLVKDNISIIQGPRSFPLYAKGVEKYRFDYAVFLLNKNIELLMIDVGIRIEDMRHTLPNLKMLLLTLAAQDRPPA